MIRLYLVFNNQAVKTLLKLMPARSSETIEKNNDTGRLTLNKIILKPIYAYHQPIELSWALICTRTLSIL